MKMIKEYRYLGSAPHLAFTSILIGSVYWQQFMTSIHKDGSALPGIAATALVYGLFLGYCYKIAVTTNSPEPLPLKTLPLSLLIINLSLLGILLPVMAFVLLFSATGQASDNSDYVMSLTYVLSIAVGIYAIFSAPRDKVKQ
ncbi:hypothetical protein [Acinetobacter sp. YH12153]|uniref:hypothetical protein n=1 Tax=Acinetobacter sp. YH12153 TaxID=2601133 RepID=UPI0015D29063|nr:hypothetical protein [Acinetobacter sp. YH12153]